MKRTLLAAMLLIAVFTINVSASSPTPTAPRFAQTVSDTADVLDAQLVTDLHAFSEEILAKAGIELKVLTRHFLGGAQAPAYARDVLASYPESTRTLLVVLVVGEETYASALGATAANVVSAETVDTLLAGSFRAPYLARDYSRALAAFALRLARQIQTNTGARINTSGMFAAYSETAAATTAPQAPQATRRPMQDWLDELDSIFRVPSENAGNAERYQERTRQAEERGGDGLGFIPIIVIGYVLFRIFGRRAGRGGCGPLGWIFGTWGASRIFRRRW
ncbi:MAG TPA: hypothetical protein VLA21_01850 [Candidatus Limnocylindria bacterium]|nr:hypothetical protein [Candidatus Limnocylindria bacterium]